MKGKILEIELLEEGSPPLCCRLLSMLAEEYEGIDGGQQERVDNDGKQETKEAKVPEDSSRNT